MSEFVSVSISLNGTNRTIRGVVEDLICIKNRSIVNKKYNKNERNLDAKKKSYTSFAGATLAEFDLEVALSSIEENNSVSKVDFNYNDEDFSQEALISFMTNISLSHPDTKIITSYEYDDCAIGGFVCVAGKASHLGEKESAFEYYGNAPIKIAKSLGYFDELLSEIEEGNTDYCLKENSKNLAKKVFEIVSRTGEADNLDGIANLFVLFCFNYCKSNILTHEAFYESINEFSE